MLFQQSIRRVSPSLLSRIPPQSASKPPSCRSTTLSHRINMSSVAADPSTLTPKPTAPHFDIQFPALSRVSDEAYISRLTTLINTVYSVAEIGIFGPGYQRTSSSEVCSLISSHELAVASSPGASDQPLGCVRVWRLSPTKGDVGTLVAAPETRGSGLGRQLVEFAEATASSWGAEVQVMQLELLVPTAFRHELKHWVQAWYERMGYVVVRTEDFYESYPRYRGLVLEDARVEYRIFEKRL